MLVAIPSLLTSQQLVEARQQIESSEWEDGKITAGRQSSIAKHNRQLPQASEASRQVAAMILESLASNGLFMSAALPKAIFPPLINRYDAAEGHFFGNHIDNAVRTLPDGYGRIRTDLSATVFLSSSSEYDGGELVIESSEGSHQIKLEAGDMILYPATSLHRVEPVTRGSRFAAFFWIQSMVRNESQRSLLLDMDAAIRTLANSVGDQDQAIISLTGAYHNLLRQWVDG